MSEPPGARSRMCVCCTPPRPWPHESGEAGGGDPLGEQRQGGKGHAVSPEHSKGASLGLDEMRDRAEFVQGFIRGDSDQGGGFLDELSTDVLALLAYVQELEARLGD